MAAAGTILCTGGIGSGKSCVVKALSALGVPSFDTDSCAKALYEKDGKLLGRVADAVGSDVIVDGHLDRKALASKIFSDSGALEKVEAIVHPAVIREFGRWKAGCGADVVVIESAVMLQKTALRDIPDYVLYVTAPRDVRVGRVMARDGLSREAVLKRMECQEDLSARADFVIETDDRQMILPALIDIIEKLKNGKDRS